MHVPALVCVVCLGLMTLWGGRTAADDVETGRGVATMVIAPDVLADYQHFMRGRRTDEVKDIDATLRRDVLEVFSTLYLLQAGGLDQDIEFVVSPSFDRHLSLMASGSVGMSAAFIDQLDISGTRGLDLVPSFVGPQVQSVGLFTSPGNAQALAAEKIADIRSLTAVSNKAWQQDWRALETAPIAELVSVADWTVMTRMVMAGRVDFLLAPIQRQAPDRLATPVGMLARMRPFAVRVDVDRSIALSLRHPDHDALRAAIEAGLASLALDHFLRDAFTRLYTPSDLEKSLMVVNRR